MAASLKQREQQYDAQPRGDPLPVEVAVIQAEHVHAGFTKWHLNRDGAQPWPFRPVLHHFDGPEGGDPHDHPFDFTTTVLRGWYAAMVYTVRDAGRFYRWPMLIGEGERRSFPAEMIHSIVETSPGGCWTWCEYGPERRAPLFYDFTPGAIRVRDAGIFNWRPLP